MERRLARWPWAYYTCVSALSCRRTWRPQLATRTHLVEADAVVTCAVGACSTANAPEQIEPVEPVDILDLILSTPATFAPRVLQPIGTVAISFESTASVGACARGHGKRGRVSTDFFAL